MGRETISKKLRFDIFKRDVFTCQYCGGTPPTVVLEIDHIHPVSKGGRNHDNLITACFECNRGKSDRLLTSVPETIKHKAEVLKERESQLREYNKLLKIIQNRQDKEIELISSVFTDYFPGYVLNPNFKDTIKHFFLPDIPSADLQHYMAKSCVAIPKDRERAIKYFCGICWKVKRGDS